MYEHTVMRINSMTETQLRRRMGVITIEEKMVIIGISCTQEEGWVWEWLVIPSLEGPISAVSLQS